MINVTVWNEFIPERENPQARAVYPEGIHECLAAGLRDAGGFSVRTATLGDSEQGLSADALDATDVLVWWGHWRHDAVDDSCVARVVDRVLSGMGLIVLHSAHHSKVFRRLLGTSCDLRWRDDDRERLWCVNPGHPIAEGVPLSFELENEEMYGEPFDIPAPDETVFLGWFAGGEAFRSGSTFTRGRGKIFYFQPGHEEYPIYRDPNVRLIIANAARWARPVNRLAAPPCCVNALPSPESARIKGDAAGTDDAGSQVN
jgi:trehalose utilization protein